MGFCFQVVVKISDTLTLFPDMITFHWCLLCVFLLTKAVSMLSILLPRHFQTYLCVLGCNVYIPSQLCKGIRNFKWAGDAFLVLHFLLQLRENIIKISADFFVLVNVHAQTTLSAKINIFFSTVWRYPRWKAFVRYCRPGLRL